MTRCEGSSRCSLVDPYLSLTTKLTCPGLAWINLAPKYLGRLFPWFLGFSSSHPTSNSCFLPFVR